MLSLPSFRPMLAVPSPSVPRGDEWAYEFKWDGVRALCAASAGEVRLTSRTGRDMTYQYPEVTDVPATPRGGAVLDGELVAFDEGGRVGFQRLQPRMHAGDRRRIARLSKEVPVTFVVFDVLWLDGGDLTRRPYTERRAVLSRIIDDLRLDDGPWQESPWSLDVDRVIAAARAFDMEGVVAKRLESVYLPGRRSSSWMKTKFVRREEFVVGGWLDGRGSRRGTVGALLIGTRLDNGRLRYAGRVGTGLTDADLRRWSQLLAPFERSTSPFDVGDPPAGAHFVEPQFVVEVRFTEWTDGGHVRHPSLLGLRDDVVAGSSSPPPPW